jgi:hypothetical protein
MTDVPNDSKSTRRAIGVLVNGELWQKIKAAAEADGCSMAAALRAAFLARMREKGST